VGWAGVASCWAPLKALGLAATAIALSASKGGCRVGNVGGSAVGCRPPLLPSASPGPRLLLTPPKFKRTKAPPLTPAWSSCSPRETTSEDAVEGAAKTDAPADVFKREGNVRGVFVGVGTPEDVAGGRVGVGRFCILVSIQQRMKTPRTSKGKETELRGVKKIKRSS